MFAAYLVVALVSVTAGYLVGLVVAARQLRDEEARLHQEWMDLERESAGLRNARSNLLSRGGALS